MVTDRMAGSRLSGNVADFGLIFSIAQDAAFSKHDFFVILRYNEKYGEEGCVL